MSEGHELITEALNLLNNVYGAMHGEIAQCLRMVARLCYVTGEHRDAMAYQQKAVFMSERVNGIDHPYTITEYVSIGNVFSVVRPAKGILSVAVVLSDLWFAKV